MECQGARLISSPLAFPEPVILKARRCPGIVASHPVALTSGDAPSLERQPSVSADILIIENGSESSDDTLSYLIHRKLRDTPFGSLRIGYVLEKDESGMYHVKGASNGDDEFEMFTIAVEDKAKSLCDLSSTRGNQRAELAALQMIGNLSSQEQMPHYMQGANAIAADDSSIYTIMSFLKDGSLYDYCTRVGRLSENDGRFFFRQLLSGLELLEQTALCHRSLSLDNVQLHGTLATIVGLSSSALRIPFGEDGDMPHLITPQPLVGSIGASTQYMAPELFNEEVFDGHAVDLWSVGVILLAMLAGSDALFLLPSQQDYRYKEICVDCHLQAHLRKLGCSISAEATDLLQAMLTADPARRLTRTQVVQHTWVAQHTDVPAILPPSKYKEEVVL
ncbi:hypothetical protein MPSEU_000277000 [Mayamaea pseudoterrestris]|nr:hypothetical protein MPSEU_000277000 [Mayamaea pseudoterrestris]